MPMPSIAASRLPARAVGTAFVLATAWLACGTSSPVAPASASPAPASPAPPAPAPAPLPVAAASAEPVAEASAAPPATASSDASAAASPSAEAGADASAPAPDAAPDGRPRLAARACREPLRVGGGWNGDARCAATARLWSAPIPPRDRACATDADCRLFPMNCGSIALSQNAFPTYARRRLPCVFPGAGACFRPPETAACVDGCCVAVRP